MGNKFLKYQTIIDRLRGEVHTDNFEHKFNLLTKQLAKTEKFLLKMEIKRLATPCTRLIDLRGLVDGECRAYEYEDCIHFLDDVAIKVFEENIAYYQEYTFGVYDQVTNTPNNFRVIYQQEKIQLTKQKALEKTTHSSEKTQYPVLHYDTKHCCDRLEERMNYVVDINVIINKNKAFDAVSSDISVNGCKLRIPSNIVLAVGERIELRFLGLEQEFEFGDQRTFTYQVRNINLLGKVQLVGVERFYSNEVKTDSFQSFLLGYIQGNKHRYKINLDNTTKTLQARILEQSIFTQINELPVFIRKDNGILSPKYIIKCQNNCTIYNYWQDENHQSTLSFLLNEQRIKRVEKAAKFGKTLLVYCFINKKNNENYFYSADEYQLKTDIELMKHFLSFAASRKSFAIFNLSLSQVQSKYAHSRFTLSNSIKKKDHYLNLPLSTEVINSISKLPFMITITEFTMPDVIADYQTLPFESLDTNKIKLFRHVKNQNIPFIDIININYHNQRQETRFDYITPVTTSINGASWSGSSQNFSTSGLKITLDKATLLKKDDIVHLSFPKLQKITSKFNLNKLPYVVVRIDKHKRIINLRVHVEKHQHIGRSFFKLLIDKNHDKLKPDEYALLIPNLAKALRNIYAQNFEVPTLMVQTSGSRYKIEIAVYNGEDDNFFNKIKELSSRKNYYNLYPLLHNSNLLDPADNQLKKLHSEDQSKIEVIYISIRNTKTSIDNRVIVKHESELKTIVLKKMFIKQALKSGTFYCIQLRLSRTNEPEMTYLNPELSYISSYAIHRAKQLEQHLWSIAGVTQVIDMTNEAMLRYRLL